MTMRMNNIKAILKAATLAAAALLLTATVSFAQQVVNMTAAPTTTTLPDGTTVPMWGYSCGAAVAGSTAACAKLSPAATGWSPVVITVPTGQSLTINLTNNLSFLPVGSSTANTVPTSVMIVGQLGGGLGTTATSTPSPDHTNAQPLTWPIAGTAPGVAPVGVGTPPAQGNRVQSFSTEVAAGATTSLTWTTPRPGTYLLESGTHPSIQGPMGLYGMVVVTCPPAATTCTAPGTAYPVNGTNTGAVTYNAEVPLILSEIDAVQNSAVDTAVHQAGFNEMTMRTFGDQVSSIAVTSGGSGYTSNPTVTITGGGGSGAVATASVGAVVTGISLSNMGAGYTTAPSVTISDTTGSGATAVAIVSYALGSVTAPTAGTGTGYLVGDVVNLTGGGGSGAAAAVATVDVNGAILTVNVSSGGSGYTSAPTISSITSVAGTGAVLTPALATTGVVSAINVTNGGSGYTSPTVTIDPATGAGATTATATAATAGTLGTIYAVTLTSGGTAYHLTPSVAIAAPGGTGTAATAYAIIGQACAGGLPCYPSAVNYTPTYFMFNGVAFDKTNATASVFSVAPATGVTAGTGTVLVRMVNAGLRMHVPAIVGSQTGVAIAPATVAPTGFLLIAEDGNPLPGVARVQSEVFLPAGKTYDVMINAPAGGTALPVFDRQLSLSGNGTARDAGMLAYVSINGSALPVASGTGVFAAAQANPDTYNSVIAGKTLTVSDPSLGVIGNDINVYGVKVVGTAPAGLTLNTDGTFIYTAGITTSFTYCGNGTTSGGACALVTLGAGNAGTAGGIVMNNIAYTSNEAAHLAIAPPGILSVDKDNAGYPLTVALSTVAPAGGLTVSVDPNGGFNASLASPCATATGCVSSFTYNAQNSQGTQSSSSATVTLTFLPASNLSVTVLDGKDKTTVITDYRWIIEEDRTFYVNPNCTTNSSVAIAGCTPPAGTGVPMTFGTNFHTSYMPVVAAGCAGPTGAIVACESGQTVIDPTTGAHVNTVCDVGNGVCRTDGSQQTAVDPAQVHLDPTKRYYLSVLPGDAGNPFGNAYGGADCVNGIANAPAGFDTTQCGHGMGGTPVIPTCTGTGTATVCVFNPVTVYVQPDPFPPSKLSVFIYEDDFPLNGEQDGGGGVGAVNVNNEPGLGQFNITLFDDAGGTGDSTGQMTYDMFNQPLSNSLAGTIDPISTLDACPISKISRIGAADPTQTGITGLITVCPVYEADGVTPSPLAGQAVIANLMPGRYGVVATPGADRIARGEEWLQTNTLDGQKAHDSFLRIQEPSYFQEYGPAGFHVAIGFANPKIINSRLAGVCNGTDSTITLITSCKNTVKGIVTTSRMSRTPDERLYSSGDNSSFAFTQCYISFGDPDGEDFAFTKCNADGSFSLSGLPDGDWRVTVFDQWNDMLVDGLSTPVGLAGGTTTDLGQVATNQWQANIYTKSFFDRNHSGVSTDYTGTACTAPGVPTGCNANFGNSQPGLTLLPTNIRYRDGSYSNFNNTDLAGNAGFNEIFPLFSWYVVETDTTRFKNTGTHVVYDAGGPSDGSTCGGTTGTVCGSSNIAGSLANTAEQIPVPAALRVPGARYCASADCNPGDTAGGSTGRVDPPWAGTEGWQGFSGQNSFIEFGKMPFAANENGGIHGEVIYASTRPFDDPALLIHTSWTPDVPGVTINLYQEGTAADKVTPTLTLVDHTTTSSWDDWAQGFNATSGNPNMSCPGQGPGTGANADLFYFTLFNQPDFLDVYNNMHNGTPLHTVPNNSQFKCYDGMHNWNQVQPAPFDGMYKFPSVTGIIPTGPNAGKPAGTNCTICVPDPDSTDPYWAGLPMLPAGKYVVEMVVPPGYELVKEEDKNILIGDNYIAPVTVQFPGLAGAVYILPDQAAIGATYNANNVQNPTHDFGRPTFPQGEGDTGSVELFWPCVGASRIVPDYISLFPQSLEVAPFAGATRNLCDRKEVAVNNESSSVAKFWVFTSAHVAAHFTGVITDDFTSEFDPFSPQFGEKFSPASLPVSIKDWTGTEISRVYTDQWGTYDGLTYSTWEVNPPNPTGYAPQMMVTCMNDPGPIPGPGGKLITDPLFNPSYSQFCYEIPFMPGQTQYMDTPVTPTSAFVGAGYNNPDCSYPDATPAISEVDSNDGIGPYVSGSGTGHTLTITSLGDQMVPNYAYTGPSASVAPYNAKTVLRHYGFGATQQNGTLAAGGVTIGGVNAPVSSWSDTSITVTVPSGVSNCLVQQQAQYGGSAAKCGELVITNGATRQGGNVTGVTITRGGLYSSQPTVTFGVPPTGGVRALGTPVLGGGGVASVTVTNGGVGYTSAPGVTFVSTNTGGGGTGAAGTATVRRKVTSVTITGSPAGGTYPGAAPTVTFGCTGCGGGGGVTNATGTAVLTTTTPRRVASVTINTPGSYPLTGTITVTFTGGGTGHVNATGTPVASGFVSAVTVTAPGTGYTSAPTVGFTGGGAPTTPAAATAVLSSNRPVVSVSITTAGSGYLVAPSVTFSPGVTGGTSTALGTATINAPSVIVSGKQSIDTVTVTIGGKGPKHLAPADSIQAAINAADPGDLIIIDPTCSTTAGVATACTTPSATNVHSPAAHNELLIMWKPVRLQGVGGASSIINANTHPAGKLDIWRQEVNCLFGLALNGQPNTTANPFDPTTAVSCPGTGWTHFTPTPINPQVDRLPLEAVVGWDAELNGNLAEQLQEPSLMGALEGAGITVLAKGVNFPSNPYDPTLLAGFPVGTTLLMGSQPESQGHGNFAVGDANPNCHTSTTVATNPFPSNYSCNPSSIDGLGITNSSQGGGAIFVHGWGHNLQIGNNRIVSNAGTLSGGINVGQGEYPPAYIQGAGLVNAPPGSCEDSPVFNAVLPYCENVNVNVHNNDIALNSSTGDELFSATPAGAGGVSFCTGSDYYLFNYNWVCGNLSTGDGGGVGHMGFSYNGDIEHNTIIFNQSTNPTIPSNGGGIIVMGTPDADIVCYGNATIDTDCTPYNPNLPPGPNNNPLTTALSAVGPSDGVGPGLVINANLIMGNAAESGNGGGIAIQGANGSDMVAFPTLPQQWNTVTVTNNIIADNVAGWDGAGISLQDSTAVNIINNTIAFNSSTASAGPLFNTMGAPLSSTPPGPSQTCPGSPNCGVNTHPQVAGVVAIQNSAILRANLPATGPAAVTINCPPGHFTASSPAPNPIGNNGNCRTLSVPKLENNVVWHNSMYYITVGALGAGTLDQQHVVALHNASAAGASSGPLAPSQGTTGACPAATFWDIGVRGDTGPANHSGGATLAASDSVLTPGGSAVTGAGNTTGGSPNFIASYCDGSRVPPEAAAANVVQATAVGWQVPPGISDATVPNPIFNLTPTATVDEGNNWVNISWGPLSMTNPTAPGGASGNYGAGLPLGNYAITTGSSAAGRVTGTNFVDAPAYDFFNNPRKTGGGGGGSTDSGAVRLAGTPGHSTFTLSAATVDFGLVPAHSPIPADQDIRVINSGTVSLAVTNATITATGISAGSFVIPTSQVATVTLVNGGSGYTVNDIVNITRGGGSGATATVTAVSATGAITAITLANPGNGYTNGLATLADVTGATTGTGATANITVFSSNNCVGTTLGAGQSCVITVVFVPTGTSQAVRTGTLNVTAGGITQTVALTGHDTIATITVSPITPALTTTPANATAKTGTITITNTINPNTNPDAGPYVPTIIRLTRVNGAPLTDYVLGGTCAAGTPINPGGTLVPPAAGSSCTVTITYTPVVGTTGAALNGTVHLLVTGYGTAATTPIINANYNAN
jgi:hypothetical protein